MSAAMLLKNEYIKTTRRLAFVLTTLIFTVMVLLVNFANLKHARSTAGGAARYGLPNAWADMLNDAGSMAVMFAAVTVILLVAAEFSWRTARQNVIDGLSKNQWFAAKLMLMLLVALFFEILVLAIGGAFAASVSYAGFARPHDWQMMGGFTLAILGFASAAFLLSMLVRNAGPAMAVLLVWLGIIENLVGVILRKINPEWAVVGRHFPFKVFPQLLEARNWDPAALQQAVAAAQKLKQPPPEAADVAVLSAFAAAYIAIFIIIAFVSYSRRDL